MARVLQRLGALGTGFLVTMVVNDIFDYIIYPVVIALLGSIRGGVIMTVLALVGNYSLVLVYDRTKQDWFGFEWLRLQEGKDSGLLGKIIRAGWWPAFLVLSWEDPFKAFVFVRGRRVPGARFDYVDWGWFFGANLIGNLIWILMLSGLIETVRAIF